MPEFGKLKYIHCSGDTYSLVLNATAHTGETTKDVIKHLMQTVSILGIPRQIKTDNWPSYISKTFQQFCQAWGILHTTGIPYKPKGQVIRERQQKRPKEQINKIKTGTHLHLGEQYKILIFCYIGNRKFKI